MKQKVVVYGNGASARGFLAGLATEYDVVAVASENPEQGQGLAAQSVHTNALPELTFDKIVVASWAIQDIRDRLNNIGIEDGRIFWYQHHKDRLVHWGHDDCFLEHKQFQAHDILYACYDLNVCRATYDFLGFLCLAESARREKGLKAIHFVIVNADNNEFNRSRWGVHDLQEHHWRVAQILVPCCKLLASCYGISQTASRTEAERLLQGAVTVFPASYSVAKPIGVFEFNHLFDRVALGFGVNYLSASGAALNYIEKYLLAYNTANKPCISITLRQTHGKPRRNSDIPAWQETAKWLNALGYFVVVIPDTDNPTIGGAEFGQCLIADAVCFNVELRMALYQRCYLNLGVNNGPMHLCAMNPDADYIMYKQVVEEYPHSAMQSFIDRGFTPGGHFPDATKTQWFIWQDDEFEVIKESVLAMIEVKQTQTAITSANLEAANDC